MATGKNREVKLTLSVETLGSDEIKKLQDSVSALARDGGDAAPEFQKLADQIGRLGEQGQALAAFQELQDSTNELAQKQQEAAVQSEDLKSKLEQATVATKAAANAQIEAVNSYKDAQKAKADLAADLIKLRSEYDAAGKKTDEYKNKLKELVDRQTENAKSIIDLTNTRREANKELASAVSAETKLQNQYDTSAKKLEQFSKQLGSQLAAFEEQRQATEALGVSTDDVSASQIKLVSALQASVDSVDVVKQNIEALTAANRELAAQEGFERQFESARRLADSSNYVRFWEDALKAAEVAERQLAEQNALAEKAAEAERLRQAAADTDLLKQSVEALAAAEKELQAQAAFEKKAQDAQRLAQASTYVRFWEDALKAAEVAESQLAEQNALAQKAAEAERLRQAAVDADLLKQSVEALAAAEKELQAQAAFEKQFEEAKRLVQAAEYVGFWEDALQQADAAADKLAQSARDMAGAIDGAFSTVGIKQASSLRAEIQSVRDAMRVLSTQAGLTGGELSAAMNAGNARIAELERELRGVTNQLTIADKAAALFSNSMGQITAGNVLADAIGAVVEKVKEMGRQFIASIVQIDTMRRALNAVFKDSEVTAKQIDFLRASAAQAGVSFGSLASEFVKFNAATQSSNITLRESNALFDAVTRAAGSLGLGSDKTALALNALSQIASKNVVSMEELRQQLGDAIPGALTLTAKGLGIADAELVKLVESGQLAARDFFPAFTKGLESIQGETNGLINVWDRFKNVLTLTAQNAGDAGWTVILGSALKVLGGLVGAVTLGFNILSEGMFTAGKAALVLVETLRGNGAQALAFFSDEVEKSTSRLAAQAAQMNYMLDPTEENRQRLLALGGANTELAKASKDASDALRVNAIEVTAQAAAAENSEAGNKAAASAAKIAGDNAFDASGKWVQLNAAMVKQVADQQNQISVSEKSARAAEIEAGNIERLAKLRGDDVEMMNAAVTAATLQQDALVNVAAARKGEADILAIQLAEMVKLAKAQDGNLEKRAAEIKAIQDKLKVAAEEAEAAAQAAEKSRQERVEKELVAKTYRDNSAALDSLRSTMLTANEVLEQTIVAERNGRASKDDVVKATTAATEATVLYNDALRDKIKQIDLSSKSQNADLAITKANNDLRMQELKNLESLAKAIGDENLATYAKIEQKKLEIEILKATTKVQILEQEGIIEGLKLKKAELDIGDPLYAQKQKELDIAIKLAQARITEAKARGAAVESLQREIDVLRNNTNVKDQNANSSRASSNSIANESEVRYKNADAIRDENDAIAAQNGLRKIGNDYVNSNGMVTDKKGNTLSSAATSLETLQLKQRAGTLSSEDLALAKAAMEQEYAKYQMYASFQGGGLGSIQGNIRGGYDQASAIYENLKAQSDTPTTSAIPVNIKIEGKNRTINVSNKSDVDELTKLIEQLANASGRSYV